MSSGIIVIGEGSTDGTDTPIAAEGKYLVNVTCQLSLEKQIV